MSYPIGIDVSHHQGKMNWDKAKVDFAFIRRTFGQDVDREFKRNWAESKRVGIPRGAYGWVLQGQNQIENAKFFVGQLDGDLGDLSPAVDFEKFSDSKPGFSELRKFTEEVRRLTGRKPFIYTSQGYWNQHTGHYDQKWVLEYPLWIANYTSLPFPKMPSVYQQNNVPWTFWQWSAEGNCKGAEYGAASRDIDLNRFNGSQTDFKVLLGNVIIESKENAKIICNFLRGRFEPVYIPGQSNVIFEQGQLLKLTGASIKEGASGITWIQVEIPNCPSCKVWISGHPNYIRIE
ncbi:MAG TPA: GH25 family lysozyme [archaeon]|nr:GH25 family lysozyme [archaeon]